MTATKNVTTKFSQTIHSSSQTHVGVVTVLESDGNQDLAYGVYARIKSKNLSPDTLTSILLFPEDVTTLRDAPNDLIARNEAL
jgi:hypothetical protein